MKCRYEYLTGGGAVRCREDADLPSGFCPEHYERSKRPRRDGEEKGRNVMIVRREDETYAIADQYGLSIVPGSVHLQGLTLEEARKVCDDRGYKVAGIRNARDWRKSPFPSTVTDPATYPTPGHKAVAEILIKLSPMQSTYGQMYPEAWQSLGNYVEDIANTINEVFMPTKAQIIAQHEDGLHKTVRHGLCPICKGEGTFEILQIKATFIAPIADRNEHSQIIIDNARREISKYLRELILPGGWSIKIE